MDGYAGEARALTSESGEVVVSEGRSGEGPIAREPTARELTAGLMARLQHMEARSRAALEQALASRPQHPATLALPSYLSPSIEELRATVQGVARDGEEAAAKLRALDPELEHAENAVSAQEELVRAMRLHPTPPPVIALIEQAAHQVVQAVRDAGQVGPRGRNPAPRGSTAFLVERAPSLRAFRRLEALSLVPVAVPVVQLADPALWPWVAGRLSQAALAHHSSLWTELDAVLAQPSKPARPKGRHTEAALGPDAPFELSRAFRQQVVLDTMQAAFWGPAWWDANVRLWRSLAPSDAHGRTAYVVATMSALSETQPAKSPMPLALRVRLVSKVQRALGLDTDEGAMVARLAEAAAELAGSPVDPDALRLAGSGAHPLSAQKLAAVWEGPIAAVVSSPLASLQGRSFRDIPGASIDEGKVSHAAGLARTLLTGRPVSLADRRAALVAAASAAAARPDALSAIFASLGAGGASPLAEPAASQSQVGAAQALRDALRLRFALEARGGQSVRMSRAGRG
jgi:hypothetical protein